MTGLAGIATIAAGFVAVGAASFGSGVFLQNRKETRKEMMEEHEELSQAHHLLHRDIDKLINQHSEIEHTSTYNICSICNRDRDPIGNTEPGEE